MDYIGSKIKLNDWIFEIIANSTDHCKDKIFLDACSGSGAISKHAVAIGYRVISNDLMRFSSVIINGSIGIDERQYEIASKEIEKLNKINGIDGYFYNNFCEKSIPPRTYFTSSNAKKIDAVRKEIEKIKNKKIKDYLLYCGLEAMSKVSNTAGVQAAFLKKFKDRAKDEFFLKNQPIINGEALTYNKDILLLLKDDEFRKKIREDILYIDPPYNQRQYGPNYHLYETFVRYDCPNPSGKTGLRNWKVESNSQFCSRKNCLEFLKNIVNFSTAKFVFISYNSDGLLTKNDFEKSFSNIQIYEKEQRRYKSDVSSDRKYNNKKLLEYVFEIHKKN